MFKTSFAVACVALTLTPSIVSAEGNPYPDLDDFQYANYAEPQQKVVYDYNDPQESY